MRKNPRKILAVFLMIQLLLSMGTMVGCNRKTNNPETEYFKYHIFGSPEGEVVKIDGLTEKGRMQKNIVIPEEIDGRPVRLFSGNSSAPNVKKIIVSYNVGTINSWGLSSGSLFVIDYPAGLKVLYVNCQYKKSTMMEPHFLIASAAEESYKGHTFSIMYSIANIQYLYNYEDAKNKGVFFIDDLEVNEELEIIPEIPKREGYTFTGWYAEPECTNEIELNGYVKTDEEIVYLYAGWKENK